MCAIEDLASSLEEKASGTLLLLVIIAALAAIAVLGDRVYLGIVDTNLDHFSQWRAVLICGLVGGLAGGLFSRLLYAGSHAARRYVSPQGLRGAMLFGVLIHVLGLIHTGPTH